MPAERPPIDRPPLRVSALVANLGSAVVAAATIPAAEAVVTDVHVHEPGLDSAIGATTLLVAIGTAPALGDLLDGTPALPGAIAVKCAPHLREELLVSGARRGCAVIVVDEAVPWVELISLALAACAEPFDARGLDDTGHDLFELAEMASSAIGGPVTIEDPRGWLLAYSSEQRGSDELRVQTLLNRRTPVAFTDRLATEGTLRALARADGPTVIEGRDGVADRVAVALRLGGRVLGTMWAIAHGTTAPQRDAFDRVGRLAALHLAHQRAHDVRAHRIEMEQLATLLHDANRAEHTARQLEIAGGAYWVAAVALDHLGSAALAETRARLDERLAAMNGVRGLDVRSGHLSSLWFVVLTTARLAMTTDAVIAWFDELVTERGARTLPVAIGVGSRVEAARALPRSRREAERALAVARSERLVGHACAFEQAWTRAALLPLTDPALTSELEHLTPLRHLREHDARLATDHLATVRAWLDAMGNVRVAAELLNVHPNTVRYRLERIAVLAGIDLSDPLARLAIDVQLRGEERARREQTTAAPGAGGPGAE